MNHSSEPTLAPPGGGLPWPEVLLARALFSIRRRMGTRRSFDALFAQELECIRRLIRECDEEEGSRRVLIARLPGLEDSSRFWSVWMTLDHLRIVHLAIAELIGELVKEVTPPGAASTASVKPNVDVGREVISAFETSCKNLSTVVAASPNLNTKARFPHPWFGPLNAAGWHALMGIHMGIHRKQIERILSGNSR